jgi:hypothetical protein
MHHQAPGDPFDLGAFNALRRQLFYPKSDLSMTGQAPPPAPAPAALLDVCTRHLGVRPETIEPLAEQGTFHALYRAGLPGGEAVVLRVNVFSQARRDFALLLDEWANRALDGAGLPAPRVHGVDLSRRWCPWDVELLEPAPGFPLRRLDNDESALRPLLFRLGQFVARLHGIATEGFGLMEAHGAGSCASWADYLNNHLQRHLRICRDIGALGSAEEARMVRRFEECRTLLNDVKPRLLHGDLGSHNTFTDGSAITALIDWEDCLSGDPVYEVAFWATFHPEPRHAAFLAGYHSDRPAPADFSTRFWLYFLRVALCKTVVRHNLGLTDRPGRPPASLRIQRALHGLEQAARAA